MKFINRLTALTFVGVCLATALPVLAAINLARHQALERQENYVASLARDALAVAESTGDQLGAGGASVNRLASKDACSETGLDLMRRIDLGSTLLQAVGHMDGNVMRCSSFGGLRAFDLGPPDLVSATGATFRTDVKLLDPKVSYLVVGTGRFVGIVHKELVLSFFDKSPNLVVGVFSWSHRRILLGRGPVLPAWIDAGEAGYRVFQTQGQLVAVVRSKRYDLGAVAALPLANVSGFGRQATVVLVSLGLIAGLILSAVLVHVVRTRASMPAMIRQGLKAGEFHLVYQPVVDLPSGRIVGAEALVRWRRGGTDIGPDTFIPAAEKAGIISLVTARVLDLLASEAQDVLRLTPCFHFAVNFAATDLYRAGIVEDVARFVARSGIGFSNLVVEVTERSLVDVDRARQTIHRLRSAGVKVAIDDFGTGYSSLGYLAQMEVDFLKIDKLFVQALGTESATNQVAARIIEMSKDLNLGIVAEGIETAEQARLLKTMKVDYAQGYLYGRAMPVEDLLQRLRAEKDVEPIPTKAAAASAGVVAKSRRTLASTGPQPA